jgi:hypothetical protein
MADSAPKPAATKPPPAKSKDKAPPASKPPKSDRPRGRPPELQKQLEDLFLGIGLMTAGAVNEFDGEVIRDNAAALAENWAKVAQSNATVKKFLTSFMETGAWSGAIMSTAAVAIPIMQNHGAIPGNIPTPFKTPPHLQRQQPATRPRPTPPMPTAPGMPTPPMAQQVPGQVPQGPGQSPITPSQARPGEPPPGVHNG